MNYFDTSALIKRFVRESGSARVAALVRADPRLAISRVAFAEAHAGFARRLRDRNLSAGTYQRLADLFDADWSAYILVDLADPILNLTRDLVQRQPLRGLDAIHLASAIRLQDQLGEVIQFVAADDRLLAAARGEGLATVDVRN